MQVEALRVSDQLKTDFVSSVSHELRTPLASIIGYVDVMLDGDSARSRTSSASSWASSSRTPAGC